MTKGSFHLFIMIGLLAFTIQLASCAQPEEKKATVTADKSSPTASAEKPASPDAVKIVRLDPAFDKLIPTGAKVEKLADGHKWTEGPVWNRKENYVLFSDIPNNAIVRWQEGQGESIFMQPSGYTGKDPFDGKEPGTNGLTYDSQGRLVACAHGDRQVVRLEDDGKKRTTLADKYEGKRLNSPNDLVYKSNGDLYFTDPIYGLPKGADDPKRELDFCGVYRLDTKGKVTLLTKEITRPNGIAFSPDEKTLYVACSDPEKAVWMAYDVKADGTLEKGRVFFDATAWAKEKRPGLPDGMKVDKDGNLWATGPGGVHVFSPDGKHLGTLDTGVPTANCAWGEDGSTLYVTANTTLLRVKTSTKGKGY
ncbi:MAG TPA: SMP-30/gluconolactonase/LRE family protein [Blastocatellia bacterium]|nr:SMP-30/gluconolactonase/LRE family protein [Blastocatellia bacterium]